MKAKLLIATTNAKLTMNANATKPLKTNINLNSMLCVSLNCSNDVNRSTKNVDEAMLRVTGINAVLLLTEETRQYINTVWKLYVKSIEVHVTSLMFMTCLSFGNVFQNILKYFLFECLADLNKFYIEMIA